MSNEFKEMFQETASAPTFSLVDEGTYEAELTDTKLDLEKDTPQLTLIYQITDDERYQGRKLFSNYNLGGQGISFLKKDLETLGLDYSNVGSPEDVMDLVTTALNTPVHIYVKQKEYQGKIYNNTYLNGVVDAPAATAPAPAKAQPKTAKPPAKKTPPPKGKSKPAKGSEDNIPF